MIQLRYMTAADVPQVVAIDRASFSDAWSAHAYLYEVNESRVSYMLVVTMPVEPDVPPTLLDRLLGRAPAAAPPQVVAYGGLWHIAEEAHISTIATHPQWRGRKLGELALVAMLQKSWLRGADYVVLEVRVSNHVAQALYTKHGFEVFDRRKGYYRDGEDAFDMRLLRTEDSLRATQAAYDALCAQLVFEDAYTLAPHPRLG